MTGSVPSPRRRPPRGYGRLTSRLALPLSAGLVLAACGPSPVDMVEHPMTTTPSRMAGEKLQRSAAPEDSCAPEPVPTEFTGTGDRAVDSLAEDGGPVEVPRSPERILALGVGAVDVACALGLQDLVVGTGGMPHDAPAYLPESLVDKPRVRLVPDAVADEARALAPDLIVLADSGGLDPAVRDALEAVAPTVVYDARSSAWTEATEAVSDAYGRPRAGGGLLLDVITRAEATAAAANPQDTWVSLVSVAREGSDQVELLPADSLGSLMVEAVGAGRPPAQRTRDGERVPPLPESPPAMGDELDGDMIFAVVGGHPGAEDAAREVFASERWTELDAVGSRRMFVVDRAVWEGAGPVAARAVLEDIRASVNGIAADG